MKTILEDDYPMLLDRKVAKILGVNEAIVLQYIHYWLEKNKEKKINYKDDRYWTFKSIQRWHDEDFNFWSESTLRRIFMSLEKKGILIVANFNKVGFDRTKWYSIDYKKLNEIVSEKSEYEEEKEEIYGEENSYVDNKNLECSIYNENNINQSKMKIYEKTGSKIDKASNTLKCHDDEMKFINMTKCNCSNNKDESIQIDKTNTNKYKENNKYIKQQLHSGIDNNNLKKIYESLKEFLGTEYTDEYYKRLNNILKIKGKDYRYLQEKIEIVKDKAPSNKCGYLYSAVKNDYKMRGSNYNYEESKLKSKNKFINFEQTVTKYAPSELEEKIRNNSIRKYGINA